MQELKPGIYYDVPFEYYCRWQAVNNSSLGAARRSLLHWRHQVSQPASEAQRFGSLAHTAVLEPRQVQQRYAVMPDFADQVRRDDGSRYANPRNTKAYKDLVTQWEHENADREVITKEDYDQLLGLVTAIYSHERAQRYLRGGRREVSIVWEDLGSGLLCKARLDSWQPDQARITDLKTTADASDFERALERYSYHRQAAFYADGIEALTCEPHEFCIVAVESAEPWGVRAAPVDADAIAIGREEYREVLGEIANATHTGIWPGYTDPDSWRLPAWRTAAQESLTLTSGGEVVCEL